MKNSDKYADPIRTRSEVFSFVAVVCDPKFLTLQLRYFTLQIVS